MTEEAPSRVEITVHPDVLLHPERLRDAVRRAAGLRASAMGELRVARKTIDARRGRPRLQLLVEVYPKESPPQPEGFSPKALPTLSGTPEVVIVGAGPAGLFCALALAERGVRAVVLDRGEPVPARRHAVAKLSQRGELDPDSNYCFGEGGAGTFSDGKLYTRAKKRGTTRDVLESLVAYGAPSEILIDSRPHIGTNRLPKVVGAMRAHLEDAGQEFLWNTRVAELLTEGSAVRGVRLADGRTLGARAVVLATGHSAQDVYRFAHDAGAQLSPKPFAMGVRIEHRQAFIDDTQYGDLAGHPALGSAAYRLVEHACDLSVFSFCMCPGGFIVPAATAQERQVVNGWSPHSRRGKYANSGFVVEVGAAQLAAAGLNPADPFAGLQYQRALEQRAYVAGGGDFVAPAQRLSDLVAGCASTSLPETSYPRGVRATDLGPVLADLAAPIRGALQAIERKMPGFAGDETIAVGVESRTSAPVRMERDGTSLQAIGLQGLYPCAEGAGYAGGIMSAALDGIRVAQVI